MSEIHNFLKDIQPFFYIRLVLPNVIGRMLMIGFGLRVPKQHVFQCGVLLYPRG